MWCKLNSSPIQSSRHLLHTYPKPAHLLRPNPTPSNSMKLLSPQFKGASPNPSLQNSIIHPFKCIFTEHVPCDLVRQTWSRQRLQPVSVAPRTSTTHCDPFLQSASCQIQWPVLHPPATSNGCPLPPFFRPSFGHGILASLHPYSHPEAPSRPPLPALLLAGCLQHIPPALSAASISTWTLHPLAYHAAAASKRPLASACVVPLLPCFLTLSHVVIGATKKSFSNLSHILSTTSTAFFKHSDSCL